MVPRREETAPPIVGGADLKECARCCETKGFLDISKVRLRVGGCAVFICKKCIKREEVAPLRLGYECPGWKYGREGYRCPRLRFNENFPSMERIVGSYNIVYFAAEQAYGPRYHRKTKGP